MSDPIGIWCGPENRPRPLQQGIKLALRTTPPYDNVHLKISNISKRLARNLPDVILDLIEIASYVYAGDQCFVRGGGTLPDDGATWRREFDYHIPVRNVGLWNDLETKDALISLLTYLSDDYYDFSFRQLTQNVTLEDYLDFDAGEPWFKADEVILFSGGLDSFAGLCEATLAQQKRVLLVSHRSAPQTDAVQRRLLGDFVELTASSNKLLHVPVWVNKSERLTKDTHQRSRSFLYASLAASLACLHKVDSAKFYENGITSCNLISSPSSKGSRASRTTHPKVLMGLADLFSLIFQKKFDVENPFFWKTKADVIRVIKDHNLESLLRFSTSCSHVRSGDAINNHCGVCSQCIGRRMAMVYNGLEEQDPEEMYRVKLPVDSMPRDADRTMVELLVKTGRDFEQIDAFGFYRTFEMASFIVTTLPGKATDNANRLFELHKRHGRQVCETLERFVVSNRAVIARGAVPNDSLLSMIVGMGSLSSDKTIERPAFDWSSSLCWEDLTIEIVDVDAAKILVNGESHAASAADMGFQDRKKRIPNRLWDLLLDFAEAGGTLEWDSSKRTRSWKPKDFQRLRNSLKSYFHLTDDPFLPYDKKTGYKTRFHIRYNRSAKD